MDKSSKEFQGNDANAMLAVRASPLLEVQNLITRKWNTFFMMTHFVQI